MKVVMVRHSHCSRGKVYWFEVPENLSSGLRPGSVVGCDTKRGNSVGKVIGSIMDAADVADVMAASGAVFPLRKITAVIRNVQMDSIRIPDIYSRTPPSDAKLAKRFLEYYHKGHFNTKIVISEDGYLADGYSAYCVAQFLHLYFIQALDYRASNYETALHCENCVNEPGRDACVL